MSLRGLYDLFLIDANGLAKNYLSKTRKKSDFWTTYPKFEVRYLYKIEFIRRHISDENLIINGYLSYYMCLLY